jgi:NAD(P)-dependent dehydrogenase (short-subunit alcohol dehydrogenase family)
MALAEAGADIVVAMKNEKSLGETLEKAWQLGRKAVAISTDVTDSAEVQRMVEQAIDGFGKIDILVNVANIQLAKPLLEVSEHEWQQVMETNLTSVFLCCRAVGKHMMAQKKGTIINIASGLALRGVANFAPYCASMGGVLQFTRALALEWALANIRVNGIGPGWFENKAAANESGRDPLLRFIPMKRRGRPDDITGLVVYLASDASQYVTGQMFVVDGGTIAHG